MVTVQELRESTGRGREIYCAMFDRLREIQQNGMFDERIAECRRGSYKDKNDADFLNQMTLVVFRSGVIAKMIEKKKDVTKRVFSRYDFTDEDETRILEEPEIKMRGYRRKVKACILNAKEMGKIIGEYGSFGRFIDSYMERCDVEALRKELMKRFAFMGNANVNSFLKDTGVDILKPDRHVRRILYRLGLIDKDENAPLTDEITAKVQEIGSLIASAAGDRLIVIGELFWSYGSGTNVRYAVCGIKPLCHECKLTDLCQEYRKKVNR